MPNFSNNLKAIHFLEAIQDSGMNIRREHCHTVQCFGYKCQRSRNDAGFPYGNTLPTEMRFTVRLESQDDGHVFYEQLLKNELFEHSFAFNATFDAYDRLKGYDDAMTVKGYVVDVREDYDATDLHDGTIQQITIEVCLLLSTITYMGREDSFKRLEITNY